MNQEEPVAPSLLHPRLLLGVAAVCAVAIFAACLTWSRDNPLPSYWDEAVYAKAAILDRFQVTMNGFRGFVAVFYEADPLRPPMLRIAALPVTLIAGAELTTLRLLSLLIMLFGAALIGLAVRREASEAAGIFAFLLAIGMPAVVHSTKMFGTEYPLFLGIGLCLWALSTRRSAVLGIGIGIGLLSKTSFAVVILPALIAASILDREWRKVTLRATPTGLLIAATWWWHDPMTPIRFGIQSGSFSRHSLGPPASLSTLAEYLWELIRCGLGPGAAIAVVIAFVFRDRLRPFAIACLAGAIPFVVLHYTSQNHNPRLLAPSLLLLCAAAAATVRSAQMPLLLVPVVVQILVMTLPVQRAEAPYVWRGVSEMMAPVEQWDWTPLRRLAESRGMPNPRIGIVGDGYAFNTPQIRYAWFRAQRDTPAYALYDATRDRSFDLKRVLDRSAEMQIVVTAPGYAGDPSDGQPANNAHNAEVAAALARDPHFQAITVDVGTRRRVNVVAFLRR
jgi:hypothetical protein